VAPNCSDAPRDLSQVLVHGANFGPADQLNDGFISASYANAGLGGGGGGYAARARSAARCWVVRQPRRLLMTVVTTKARSEARRPL